MLMRLPKRTPARLPLMAASLKKPMWQVFARILPAGQMLAGVFRFVCANGMVCGDVQGDIRVRHSGEILDNVIEGAFTVLKGFDAVDHQRGAIERAGFESG